MLQRQARKVWEIAERMVFSGSQRDDQHQQLRACASNLPAYRPCKMPFATAQGHGSNSGQAVDRNHRWLGRAGSTRMAAGGRYPGSANAYSHDNAPPGPSAWPTSSLPSPSRPPPPSLSPHPHKWVDGGLERIRDSFTVYSRSLSAHGLRRLADGEGNSRSSAESGIGGGGWGERERFPD